MNSMGLNQESLLGGFSLVSVIPETARPPSPLFPSLWPTQSEDDEDEDLYNDSLLCNE